MAQEVATDAIFDEAEFLRCLPQRDRSWPGLGTGCWKSAINRVPAQGEVRANMHVGGQAVQSDLTERDLEICRIIGPELKRRGLVFVGIDVIGDYLTEINVTSPTGIQELRRFSGVDVSALLVDWVEARRG